MRSCARFLFVVVFAFFFAEYAFKEIDASIRERFDQSSSYAPPASFSESPSQYCPPLLLRSSTPALELGCGSGCTCLDGKQVWRDRSLDVQRAATTLPGRCRRPIRVHSAIADDGWGVTSGDIGHSKLGSSVCSSSSADVCLYRQYFPVVPSLANTKGREINAFHRWLCKPSVLRIFCALGLVG